MNDNQLPTLYQEYIAKSRYSRWIEEESRRENWNEVVDRYIDFFKERSQISDKEAKELHKEILELKVMPSMRCLMSAGKALERDNVAGFNCAYVAIEDTRCFDELMYILMCGTGVGFSVEKENIVKLPVIAETFHKTDTTIVVSDSKIGWCSAYRELLAMLWAGKIPQWDVSRVRPAGSRLKTFGGRASGPEPLVDLFEFSARLVSGAAGRKLTALEVHDLVCKIAEIVVVGGVRRSALISLSSLDDTQMQKAKSGSWYETNIQRSLSNNSAVYDEKPPMEIFLKEWSSLYESKSGERGIFSRLASKKQAAKNGRRNATDYQFGTNPCCEIILRSKQFCNLTEVIVRPKDSLDTLIQKVEAATALGTLQCTLTDFRYLRKEWQSNTEEEALLGVSLTGIMDHEVLNGSEGTKKLESWLIKMKEASIKTNKVWAKKLKCNPSVAITCVKPSGTVSQLADTASGIHPRMYPYYLRRVRADDKDPLAIFMQDKGFPVEKDRRSKSSLVFSFPIKSPEGSLCRKDFNCIKQLELWKVYQETWCEHKPSISVYYTESEFLELGDWVYKNFDAISGVSFFPHDDNVYDQTPYHPIDKKEYTEFLKNMPKKIDWQELADFEKEDTTTNAQELACTGGACEI
jgi:ribonucleoside-diphosphate reductase alpha chain